MDKNTITLEELQAELDRLGAGRQESQGKTVTELSSEWGMSVHLVRKKLKLTAQHGMLGVSSKLEPRIDGQPQKVPTYWFKKPAGKAKR